MAGWLVAQIHPCCPSPETRHGMEMALMRQLQFLHRTAVRLSPSADSPDRKLESSLFHTEVNWPMGFHVLVLAVGPDRICAHKPSFFRECGSTNRPHSFALERPLLPHQCIFCRWRPVGKKQCCRTLLAYILIVAVNGTLWDYSKIPSGMLHVIHWIFFCLFPTKRFHREKTMMSSSSPLCWERIIARFCWLEHFSQWHL